MSKKVVIPLALEGFDPTEVAVPWKFLTTNNIEVTFATKTKEVAQADPIMLTGKGLKLFQFLKADRNGVDAYNELIKTHHFQNPISWDEIDVNDYDGILLPGGHAKEVKTYLESDILYKKVLDFHQQKKMIAAICHGVVILARTKEKSGKSIINKIKVTALTNFMEQTAYFLTRLYMGNYYRTYPEITVQNEIVQELENSKQFFRGTLPLFRDNVRKIKRGFVVKDYHFITARWPGDVHRFSLEMINFLERS